MARVKKVGCGTIREPSVALRRARKTPPAGSARKALVTSRLDPTRVPLVVQAKVLGAFRLFLAFDDGVAGEIDLASRLYGQVFEPLQDQRYFAQVRVHPELGTVVWPNGADFAPEFLYDAIRKAGSRP